MLIGLYRDRNPLKTIRKERLLALVNEALKQNVKLVVFETKDVNFKTQEINGKIFNGTIWENKKTPFPAIMINEIPGLTKNRSDGEKKLREKIKCTSFLIGNKKDIYNKLNKHAQLKNLVIPTITMKHAEEALNFLDSKYSKIVIKPVNGKQGRNVYLIEKTNKTYLVKDHVENKEYSKEDILKFIGELLKEKTYLLQPYIECKTVDDEPYDYRIHIQRNGNGEWSLTKMYPRMGDKNSILSNISRGGHTEDINDFLQKEFSDHSSDVANMLKTTAFEVAEYIDSFYKFSIDELGIDLAIDTNGDLWLYEVNAGPQSRYHEDLRAVNTISYAKYLTGKTKENNQVNEPMIGLLSQTRNVSDLKFACAAVAKLYNANFCFFSYADMNFETKQVKVNMYLNGQWTKKILSYKKDIHVIYDRLKKRGYTKFLQVYKELEHIPFNDSLRGGTANKQKIYQFLKETEFGSNYLIDYKEVTDSNSVKEFIEKYGHIILKPISGTLGNGIYTIKQNENGYIIQRDNEENIVQEKDLKDELLNIMQGKKYIVQQFILSRTEDEQPFDIRIHMMRGKNEKWNFVNIYPRIGVNPVRINSTSQGGYIGAVSGFLNRQYREKGVSIHKELKKMALECILHLEKFYAKKLFEVGLDVAIDKQGKIFFIEANTNQPGVIYYHFDLAKCAIPYCIDLYYKKEK